MSDKENEVYVGAGDAILRRFQQQRESFHTDHVGPCVTLVRYDEDKGGMYHLWVDLTREDDARKKISDVLADANSDTKVAIVGGMDRPPQKSHFPNAVNSSERAIALMKEGIANCNAQLVHEDTMGMHQRSIRLLANGDMEVGDYWQKGEGKYPYTVNLATLTRAQTGEIAHGWQQTIAEQSGTGDEHARSKGKRTPPEQTGKQGGRWQDKPNDT